MKLRTKWTKRILATLLSASLVLVNDSVLSVALTVTDGEETVETVSENFMQEVETESEEKEKLETSEEQGSDDTELLTPDEQEDYDTENPTSKELEDVNHLDGKEDGENLEQIQVTEEAVSENDGPEENIQNEDIDLSEIPEEELSMYTIAWSYDASESEGDKYVSHGVVEMVSGGINQGDNSNEFLAEAGTEIIIRLIPDYGYQVVNASVSGGGELKSVANTNEFTFIMPESDVYFSDIFKEVEDIVTNTSSVVSEATFEGEKVAEDGGTAMMTISDTMPVDEKTIETLIDSSQSIDPNKEIQAVDITMDQLFYENTENDVWTENVTELDSAVTITLVVEQDAEDYAVIRTHEGCIEVIPAIYNRENKTITFASDKFSDFTLVPIDAPQITGDNYDYDQEGGFSVCVIDENSGISNFSSITIPEGCHLSIVDVSVKANVVTIEGGAYLEIFGSGYLDAEEINASRGARMFLNSNANKPSCVASIYDITEEEFDITDDTEWHDFDFEYIDDEFFNGWGVFLGGGPEYSVWVEGYDYGDVDVSVLFSTDEGVSYGDPCNIPNEDFDENGIAGIFGIPEGTTNVKITVGINEGIQKRIYYAYSGELDNGAPGTIMEDKHGMYTYTQVFDHNLGEENSSFIPHEVHIVLDTWRRGTENTKRLIENELYAYSDLDGNSTINENDMKLGLATELCSRFFWDAGGIIDDGVFDIYKPLDLFDPSDQENSRIIVESVGTITAKNASDEDVSINKYSYTIKLNNEIEAKGYVYGLTGYNQILVYTGSAYFIRSTSDEMAFYEDTSNPGNNDMAICIKAAFSSRNVRIGGNGAAQGSETINPEEDEVYCTYLNNEKGDNPGGLFVDYFNRYYTSYPRLSGYGGCNKVRIVNPSQTYVIVNPEGETKDVYGINSNQVDRVCQTGAGRQTEIFVGNRYVHIEAVNSAIANVVSISAVELKEDSMSDGVTITKIADNDFKVEFKSNFYDSVPLIITYEGGTKREITINRVGLVVNTSYLADFEDTYYFFHGNEQGSNGCNYNYGAGQTVIVYATYYHPSSDGTSDGSDNLSLFVTYDDGSTAVIPKTAYTAATGDCVAMTDFVIAFRQGREIFEDGHFGGNIDPSMQGMHAIVLNNGFNDNTTFSGTQVGSGKGVYWNGHIEWNY